MTELALKNYSAIRPVFVNSVLEGLSLVATNKADAFVGDLATVTYKTNEFNMNNLRVAAILQMGIPGFSMAVRADWAPLALIIDKVLATVTYEQDQQIRKHWLQHTEQDAHISIKDEGASPLNIQTGLIAALFLAILLLFFYLLNEERKKQARSNPLLCLNLPKGRRW